MPERKAPPPPHTPALAQLAAGCSCISPSLCPPRRPPTQPAAARPAKHNTEISASGRVTSAVAQGFSGAGSGFGPAVRHHVRGRSRPYPLWGQAGCSTQRARLGAALDPQRRHKQPPQAPHLHGVSASAPQPAQGTAVGWRGEPRHAGGMTAALQRASGTAGSNYGGARGRSVAGSNPEAHHFRTSPSKSGR